MVNSPELAPPAPTRLLQQPNPMPRPRGTKERTVGFDKTTDGTGTSILQSALRRQQKKMEKEEGKALRDLHRKQKKEDGSVANLEYLESLHKRAKRKRQKDQESTEALPPHDLPPKDRPPQDRPPDPPPPFRDKETSREKSRLVTGPHETVPPRSDSQHKKKKGRGNQGEPRSLMQPQPLSYVHPFAPTLLEWEKGIQVDCGPEWDMATCEAAVDRGPHPSAMTAEAITLFAEDISYQEKAGFCQVYLWEDLKRLHPENLKISPVAVVPQVGRRGRIILDLSFPVYQNVDGTVTIIQNSVNDTTAITAPTIPVKEIGKVLHRLLYFMKMTRSGEWILFSKLDISDGFWRLVVRRKDSFNFAYVLPQPPGQPIRIVVPSAVQMGWTESPSYFCAVTESARDITQHLIDNNISLPAHPIEQMMTIPHVPAKARTTKPSSSIQVYVDDFVNAATQSTDGTYLEKIRRASIHGVHALFPETSITNHANGKEPISKSKLDKGDGNFEPIKIMIGFEFNGIKRTVRLPPEKAKVFLRETHNMLRRKRIPMKNLQTVVGKLRHAAVILPAALGFFTPLNNIMKSNEYSIILNDEARAALLDICTLLRQLSKRPTHVDEIIPNLPSHVAYHDAAAEGAGGVWFSLSASMQPVVWRVAFPQDIANDVVSDNNVKGSITNSDLELAAEVLAVGIILENATTIKHETIGTLCDNTPTVSWIERMASKSIFPTAGRLLRGLAYMLHSHHAGGVITVHVKGVDNVMADLASRPSKAMALFAPTNTCLSDDEFLSSFNTEFPLPHKQDWKLATVPEWLKYNVFETLRGKRLDLQQWGNQSGPDIGRRGKTTASSTKQAAVAHHLQTRPTCSSLLLLPCGKVSMASEVRSRFSQCQKLCEPSPKNTFWTDTKTLENPTQPNTILTSQ